MSPKKKKHEEHENHERWLVSYADFITLLFAFFVVMYSTSSVNEGKFRAVSDSAQAAFNPSHLTSKKIEIGPKFNPSEKYTAKIEHIAVIKEVLKDLENKNKLNIFQDRRGIVIRITDTALFDSGSAEIRKEAIDAIDRLAGIITPMKENLHVEGHTDNIPINSIQFPSNWELSSARSTSIVRHFVSHGVDPARLTAIGYGEYRPIAGNDTNEGKTKNRRVDIVILNEERKTEQQEFVNPFSKLKIE